MMLRPAVLFLSALLCVSCGSTQSSPGIDYNNMPGYNYDESKIPPYTLLDPLRMTDGTPVAAPEQWWNQRRPQIVELFEDNVYGRVPEVAKHANIVAREVEPPTTALNGHARRQQVDLIFGPEPKAGAHTAWRMRILAYLPAHAHTHVPMIFGLNGSGNQSVVDDPGIRPTDVRLEQDGNSAPKYQAPEANTRGSQTSQWQVEKVLSRGYGLATAYYQDIEPDAPNRRGEGVRALFDTPGQTEKPDNWGALAAWAWGYTKAVDYLRTNPAIDPLHIAVTGHSRLGKAADWAAATDPNIEALLSTESGKGGQSIQRREIGETVAHLAGTFPYWFCPAYTRWVGHDREIPADGNLLLSLTAPRPLYVASAQGDKWADPKGEFLSARSAATVYTLLGEKAHDPDAAMPPVDHPVNLDGNTAYHVRTGKHDVTEFDWRHYLDFLDAHWGVPADR